MISAKRLMTAVVGIAIGCFVSATSLCMAGDAPESARSVLDRVLKGVQANDYGSFVADGDNDLKESLTKQILEGISTPMAPRMKKGYAVTYLGVVKRSGCDVYLWKLTYKDAGDDTLVMLNLKDWKVSRIWIE